MPSRRIDVVVFDSEELTRSAFCALLRSQHDLRVVDDVWDPNQLTTVLSHHRPDVLVVIEPPDRVRALDVRRAFAPFAGLGRVVVSESRASRAPAPAGAASLHLAKTACAAELFAAVRRTHRASLERRAPTPLERGQNKRESNAGARLTARQREVLQLIVEGNSTKQVAAKLGLSVKTVETHRAQLMARLGVRDLASLVRLALLGPAFQPPSVHICGTCLGRERRGGKRPSTLPPSAPPR